MVVALSVTPRTLRERIGETEALTQRVVQALRSLLDDEATGQVILERHEAVRAAHVDLRACVDFTDEMLGIIPGQMILPIDHEE